MADLYFTIKHTAGKTVNFRLVDQAGKVFDFSDDTWKTLASASDATLEGTENTDLGDGTDSLYTASYSGLSVHSAGSIKTLVIQALEDGDVVGVGEMRIYAGEDLASKKGWS